MDKGIFAGLAVIGAIFGLLGAIAVFINAYEGYSHYPGISRKKRISMSIEYAVIAFVIMVIAVFVVFFFINKGITK